jgi:hypothetical protein
MAHEARSERARLSRGARRARLAAARPTSRSLTGVFFGLPPVALLGAALVLGFRGGGIVSEQWAPVAVGTAVALGALGAVGSIPRIPRSAWAALAALAGFFAWSALSLAWTPAPEGTLETIARLALLVLATVVGASFAVRRGVAHGVAGALAVGGALLVVVIEAKVLARSTGMFSTTRLIWPIDYANGNGALVWLALPALLAGAAAERIRPIGRALVAAVAGLALAEGVMTQSRGGRVLRGDRDGPGAVRAYARWGGVAGSGALWTVDRGSAWGGLVRRGCPRGGRSLERRHGGRHRPVTRGHRAGLAGDVPAARPWCGDRGLGVRPRGRSDRIRRAFRPT